jgi:hypothetical protein
MSVTPHASQTFVDAGTGIMNSNPEQDGTAHRDRTSRIRKSSEVATIHPQSTNRISLRRRGQENYDSLNVGNALTVTVQNLRKLARYVARPPPIPKAA